MSTSESVIPEPARRALTEISLALSIVFAELEPHGTLPRKEEFDDAACTLVMELYNRGLSIVPTKDYEALFGKGGKH